MNKSAIETILENSTDFAIAQESSRSLKHQLHAKAEVMGPETGFADTRRPNRNGRADLRRRANGLDVDAAVKLIGRAGHVAHVQIGVAECHLDVFREIDM